MLYGSNSERDDVRLMARDVVRYSGEDQGAWLWGLAEAAAGPRLCGVWGVGM